MKKILFYFALPLFMGLFSNGNLFCQTNKTTVKTSTQPKSQAYWTKTSLNNGSDNINCMAVIGNKIFAGISGPKGLYVSKNNGESWSKVEGWYSSVGFDCIAFYGLKIFAGNSLGIFLSTDSCNTWNNVGGYELDYKTIRTITISGNNIFVGTNTYGVYMSTNGTKWTRVSSGLPGSHVLSTAVIGDKILAGTHTYGLYVSTDNGSSWTHVSNGLPFSKFGESPTKINCLSVFGTNVFAGTSKGAYLSTDSAKTWTAINSGLSNNNDVRIFLKSGDNIFAGTSSGVFLTSNNGTSWTNVSSGLSSLDVTALAINETTIFAGTMNDGVFKSSINAIIKK